MRIEIFVVRSPKEALNKLEKAHKALVRLFGGCTIIPNCSGAWIDKNGSEINDNVEIWLIYAYNLHFAYRDAVFIKRTVQKSLRPILTDIKDATCQQSQAYGLNNEICLI